MTDIQDKIPKSIRIKCHYLIWFYKWNSLHVYSLVSFLHARCCLETFNSYIYIFLHISIQVHLFSNNDWNVHKAHLTMSDLSNSTIHSFLLWKYYVIYIKYIMYVFSVLFTFTCQLLNKLNNS